MKFYGRIKQKEQIHKMLNSDEQMIDEEIEQIKASGLLSYRYVFSHGAVLDVRIVQSLY